ncbi:MAG: SdrD B-like domain-containing protein, partial [Maribacter sp.]
QSFHGTITVNGVAYTVEPKKSGHHFILAEGASLEPGQFGFGAWTAGSFGNGGEWFGNLEPIEIEDCSDITYLWSNGETTSSITVTEAGEYNVTVTACNGCEATDKVVVTFVEPKAYIMEGGDSFCIDGEADYLTDNTISVSGDIMGANNTFVVTDSEGNILGLPATLEAVKGIDFDGAGAGTCLIWHLSFEDGLQGATTGANANDLEGCFNLSNPISVVRNEAPTADAGDDVTICAGEEAMLTATGGGTYLWSSGETAASIKVDPTVTTTYTVTVTSAEGCEDTDEVVVNVLTLKAYVLEGGDSFCIDGEADYLTDNTISVSGDLMGANNTFVVTDSDGNILGLPGTLEAVKDINFDGSGAGTCLVWHLSFEDGLQGATMGANANDLEGCFNLSNPISVVRNEAPTADAGDDVTICAGEEAMLTATGGGTYLWSTGETTASIKVDPTATTTYSVTVTSDEDCEATDEVIVSVDDKVIIGDFVWLDENRNGLQDDGATGVNDVKVTLYQCNGDEVASTMTADNADGDAGAYSFEVCPNSGAYYIIFGDIPDGMEFTSSNSGDDTKDSDANENGRTDCFEVTDMDDPTIDGGLTEICDIKIDAGEDVSICVNETIEITAELIDNTAECPSVCVFPIIEQERCSGALGNYEIFLMSTTGSIVDAKFKTSEQKLERYADNSARYTATATNGLDVIQIDAMFTGYTASTPIGSPKLNQCQEYDSSDWEYWTTWSGTVTSENHGVFNLSVKGAAFQMGLGADQMRTGLGASGWFYAEGGDGFYVDGDVNVAIKPCVESGVMYKWSTEDGSIVSDSNQKTIKVNKPGTYVVEAINCIDCFTTDTIVVEKGVCPVVMRSQPTPKMSTVYPVPVQSGGRLTIMFDIPTVSNDEFNVVPLKASVDYIERKEDVGIMLYDITGRMISIPRTFKIIDGKAVIYLDLDYIPSGKYILRAQGPNWSDAKNIVVK